MNQDNTNSTGRKSESIREASKLYTSDEQIAEQWRKDYPGIEVVITPKDITVGTTPITDLDEILESLRQGLDAHTTHPKHEVAEAKQSIEALITECVVAELNKWLPMIERLSKYVDSPDSLNEYEARIAQLKEAK